jgi:adenine-specific DNA-methyltransferase
VERFVNPITADDSLAQSLDMRSEVIGKLKALFPGLVVEGKNGQSIDIDVLRLLVDDAIASTQEEKYGLNWNGKRRARQQALMPSSGTLRPLPAESIDWDTTRNVIIEGDNLEVLKLLQKSYARKVRLIYIDPPYNTGTDLLYPNDYQDAIRTYLEVTGQAEGGAALTSNTEASGRYHSNWLNMMYPRLCLARSLLAPNGVLVCTIDEHELSNLGVILKEVFEEGSYDHVAVTIVHNPRGVQGTNFSYTHEYAFFVFPRGAKAIGDRRLTQDEVSWSQFRNWGTESERADAKNCFYAVYVQDGQVVGFGEVCQDNEHTKQTEVHGGIAYVYPIDRSGVERKWRYARQSAEAIKHLLRARQTEYGYEIEIGKDFGTYRTVWTHKRYDANIYGTQILKALVPDSPFTFPKSLWSVYDCVQAVTADDPNAIILDFFAGSGTTAHAVVELNKNDGGHRRYILVQLPEQVADHARFRTIADVTKERMRAVGKTLKAENALFSGDLGFRVFKLDSSNIRGWEPDREDLAKTLLESVEHLKPARTEADVLYELLLKLGLDLCVPIEKRALGGKDVHAVGGGVLMICLAERIERAGVEGLGQGIVEWHKALAPAGDTTCVFRDSAFADDVSKTNMAAILEQHGIANVRSL